MITGIAEKVKSALSECIQWEATTTGKVLKIGQTEFDIDGWITTPSILIKDSTNSDGGGSLYVTISNEPYEFSFSKAVELGLLNKV